MTLRRTNSCEVAVIGAGPYGLSVAAHLRHAGVATQVFGEPMGFWRHHMPKGMMLRSPWRGTQISSPNGALTLDAYASQHGVDAGKQLPLEQFVAYGTWFQQQAVPDVDRRTLRLLDATSNGFRLTLADGEVATAGRVVVATGLLNQEYRPPAFRDLPAAFVTHCCEHTDLTVFRGKRVAVIGRGQSACESAALLAESGAAVEIISRGEIHWLGGATGAAAPNRAAAWLREALKSPSEVGPFPLSWLAEVPAAARFMPAKLRDEFTQRCLKPGSAAWLKPRFADVTCIPDLTITGVRALSDRIVLDLENGAKIFDHVLLGTGYRIDLSRLGILSPQLLEKIACADGSPLLGAGFESTVPNLHFVGSYAVKSFGPLLRFIAGAPFAARSITRAARRGTARTLAGYPRAGRTFDAATAHLSPPQ
jgi:cation diffusion facilitator CzcD-associated flavoprotein CzcO